MGDACAAKYGDALSLFSTEQAARDIDAIRVGLGDQKVNWLGFSYGTLLGATYAQLFPTHIRAMVLDGAVDPTVSPIDSSEGQAKGFEHAFDDFSTWCKAHTSACPIADNPRGEVMAAINNARTHPVVGPGGRKATSGLIDLAVIQSLYLQDFWTYMAQAIANLKQGDTRLVFALADNYSERDNNGHYSNTTDAFNAVECTDSPSPSVDQIRALQSQWRAKYPLFGATLAVGLLNCAEWPSTKDPYPTGKAVGAPPIVVVGTTNDPATPYASTAKLANMLGNSTVVTWQGEGHTAYLSSSCVRDAIDKYLTDLTVPATGLTCPPN
jgi:pimeloyl-ACP methyl ester carboxylesterase